MKSNVGTVTLHDVDIIRAGKDGGGRIACAKIRQALRADIGANGQDRVVRCDKSQIGLQRRNRVLGQENRESLLGAEQAPPALSFAFNVGRGQRSTTIIDCKDLSRAGAQNVVQWSHTIIPPSTPMICPVT